MAMTDVDATQSVQAHTLPAFLVLEQDRALTGYTFTKLIVLTTA